MKCHYLLKASAEPLSIINNLSKILNFKNLQKNIQKNSGQKLTLQMYLT